MLNQKDILETQAMIEKQHLDIRTITMGISLLDCCDPDLKTCCDKIYQKITRCAKDLVKVGNEIEAEFGIPIVNKRISVTPIALVAGSCQTDSYVEIAKTLDAAAKTCGVNFIGGFSALVQKGATTGDWKLIRSIPAAMAATERECGLYQGRYQYGCRCRNGPHHQAGRRSHQGRRLHGLRQNCGICQRGGG